MPQGPEKRQKYYRLLVEDRLGLGMFGCPHCKIGWGEFAEDGSWACDSCPASGSAESLAVTLCIDPEISADDGSEVAHEYKY